MLSAFTNCLKIPELRQKIFFTLALLFIARVGANIPFPGVDPSPIKEFFELREQSEVNPKVMIFWDSIICLQEVLYSMVLCLHSV